MPLEDRQGIAIFKNGMETGYISISSRGIHSHMIYDSEEYIDTIGILSGNGIELVFETDGIEAAAGNFGALYSDGIFVELDDEDIDCDRNLELASWK